MNKKVKDNNTPIDPEAIIGIADEIARMENNLSHMDPALPGVKQLSRSVSRMKDFLRTAGIEMADLLGKPYTDGMMVLAEFVPDGNVPAGEFIITGVKQPQISIGGKIVRPAQVTVGFNLN